MPYKDLMSFIIRFIIFPVSVENKIPAKTLAFCLVQSVLVEK